MELPEAYSPPWTWERLRAIAAQLPLTRSQYVVGATGSLLAHGELASAETVELIVTPSARERLATSGWVEDEDVLRHPTEAGLVAVEAQDEGYFSLASADLFAESETWEGVPVVPDRLFTEDGRRVLVTINQGAADAADPDVPVRRRHRRAAAIVIVVFVLFVVAISGGFDQLAGRTDKVSARVDSIRTWSSCQHHLDETTTDYHLSWTHHGETHHRTVSRCEAPAYAVGDPMPIWIHGDGAFASDSSPGTDRVVVLFIIVGIPFFLIVTGVVVRRRRAGSSGDGRTPS